MKEVTIEGRGCDRDEDAEDRMKGLPKEERARSEHDECLPPPSGRFRAQLRRYACIVNAFLTD